MHPPSRPGKPHASWLKGLRPTANLFSSGSASSADGAVRAFFDYWYQVCLSDIAKVELLHNTLLLLLVAETAFVSCADVCLDLTLSGSVLSMKAYVEVCLTLTR